MDSDKLNITVSEDYIPSDGEINNIVYVICKYTDEWPMRMADLAVCKMMAGEIKGPAGITNLIDVTCEYVWDHICGEPDEPSKDDFFNHMKPFFEQWYLNSTPEERSQI